MAASAELLTWAETAKREGFDALPDCEKVHVQGLYIKELVTLIREKDEIKSNRYRDALTAEEEKSLQDNTAMGNSLQETVVKQQSKKEIVDQKEKEPVKRKKTLKEKVNEKILSAVSNLKKFPIALTKSMKKKKEVELEINEAALDLLEKDLVLLTGREATVTQLTAVDIQLQKLAEEEERLGVEVRPRLLLSPEEMVSGEQKIVVFNKDGKFGKRISSQLGVLKAKGESKAKRDNVQLNPEMPVTFFYKRKEALQSEIFDPMLTVIAEEYAKPRYLNVPVIKITDVVDIWNEGIGLNGHVKWCLQLKQAVPMKMKFIGDTRPACDKDDIDFYGRSLNRPTSYSKTMVKDQCVWFYLPKGSDTTVYASGMHAGCTFGADIPLHPAL